MYVLLLNFRKACEDQAEQKVVAVEMVVADEKVVATEVDASTPWESSRSQIYQLLKESGPSGSVYAPDVRGGSPRSQRCTRSEEASEARSIDS